MAKGGEARRLQPALAGELLRPGMRVAVAVSGGADSVALLRLLADARSPLGLVLNVAHMHHGIRGQAADRDAEFVQTLAQQLNLPCLHRDVDTPGAARSAGAGLEQAARTLRYGWFRELLIGGDFDAVATAHTRDDQAETVLHKLIRGAWTEGLGGIHPRLRGAELPGSAGGADGGLRAGAVIRPLLDTTRKQIVTWLRALGQPWQEDETNRDLAYTRNRIRHRLLPELAAYNPAITEQLAHLALLARDDEDHWQREVKRLLPGLLLPGRAVRGGGRAESTLPGERSLAVELERLLGLHPALLRRLLRGAAAQLGVELNFEQTARLFALVGAPPGFQTSLRREQLTGELVAERTPRELRLSFCAAGAGSATLSAGTDAEAVEFPVPGLGEALGWRLRCSLLNPDAPAGKAAVLRAARPSDLVQLRHSRGKPKRMKEVWERLGIASNARAEWPVLIWHGEIVWLKGVLLEPTEVSRELLVEAVELDQNQVTAE